MELLQSRRSTLLWLCRLLAIGVDHKPAFSGSVELLRNPLLLGSLLFQSLLLQLCLTHLLLLTALLLLFLASLTGLLLGQLLLDSLLFTFGSLLAGFLFELADELLTRDDLALLALPELGGDHLQLGALQVVGLGAGIARDEVTSFLAVETVIRVLQGQGQQTS